MQSNDKNVVQKLWKKVSEMRRKVASRNIFQHFFSFNLHSPKRLVQFQLFEKLTRAN